MLDSETKRNSPVTVVHPIPTSAALSLGDRWDHVLARVGYRRSEYRVAPGLYSLGIPSPESPVFVSANYTLSFDALRSAVPGIDAYILVLDTRGVNVWCAAAKGTFSSDELVRRVEACRLSDVVDHRQLIVPQLGAPGIAAHDVLRRTGFNVDYGPVRASDLPEFLRLGDATDEMRLVGFTLADRLTLVPIEVVPVLLPTLLVAAALWFISGPLATGAAIGAVVAGTILFPAFLPWLPTRECTTKGAILGAVVAAPFALAAYQALSEWPLVATAMALALLTAMVPVTAFLALMFTGSTTFTSRTGVRREIDSNTRAMAASFAVGIVLLLLVALVTKVGSST